MGFRPHRRGRQGVSLSIIIPIAQMKENAEKLRNLPKTYSGEVEKPEF